MKKKLIPVMLMAGGCLFAAPRVSFSVGVGSPVYTAPPAYAAVRPPCPGPGYTWVDGSWTNGAWVNGYWTPPYSGSYFVAHDRDRHDGDRDRARFQDHDRDQGRGRGEGFRDRR